MQTSKDAPRGPYGTSNAPAAFSPSSSHLGPSLRVKGEIIGDEDLKLEGSVEGSVSVGGFRLTVGPNAHLKADLVAREALISGEVIGDIRAADRIEIQKTASITGHLTTGRIVIEEGAYFRGDVEVGTQTGSIGKDFDSLLRDANKPPQV
jgi:cytoskeletal protein CcmA (bactofilin family)